MLQSTVDDCILGQGWLGKWGNQIPQARLKEWKGKGNYSEKTKEENVGNIKWENKKKPVYHSLISFHLCSNVPQDLCICQGKWKLFDAELLIKEKIKEKETKKSFKNVSKMQKWAKISLSASSLVHRPEKDWVFAYLCTPWINPLTYMGLTLSMQNSFFPGHDFLQNHKIVHLYSHFNRIPRYERCYR